MSIKGWKITTCIVAISLITFCTIDFCRDKRRYNDVVKSNTIEACDMYLTLPYSEVIRKNHIQEVLKIRELLKEDVVWNEVYTNRNFANYLEKYPRGRYSEKARELQEDDYWEEINTNRNFANYLEKYPRGRYSEKARELQEDDCWQEAVSSKSYANYLAKYPNGNYSEIAKWRIEEQEEAKKWRTDALAWNEATKKNTIAAYKKYLELYPKGNNAQQAKKRIIDKEVDEIFANDYGALPSMDRTASSGNGTHTQISVYNSTSYSLTVRYSGIESRSITISAGETRNISLRNGNYRVAASVNARSVSNYAGTEILDGGIYNVKYYIVTTRY